MSDAPRADNSIHDAIDALFDGDMTDGDARHLLNRADPASCEAIAKTQRMVDMLKAPVDSPDLTDRILKQVEDEREFVDAPWRRFVRAGRLAVAACLLIGLLGVAVAQRAWPDAMTLTAEPRPVSTLLDTTEQQAVDRVRAFNHSLEFADQKAHAVRDAVRGSRPEPQKFSTAERHVLAVAPADPPVRMSVSLDVPSGAGLTRSEAEAVAWHAPGPFVADEYVQALTFRSGMTWSFDLNEVVELQLLKREAEPPIVELYGFRKLP